MADFVNALLGSLGADPTPQNMRFLNAWIRAEGTKAAFNPLATTQVAPGASSFNSVGVRNYSDFASGVDATKRTLLNGRYSPIVNGLRSGTATADQLGQAVAASPWGTGRGVLNVLGSKGLASTPPMPTSTVPSTSTAPATAMPAQPNIPGALLASLGQSPGAQLSSILGALTSAAGLPGLEMSAPPLGTAPPVGMAGVPRSNLKPGSPVPASMLSSIGAEHPTAGLEGFPAHDFMAPAGSPVVAPVGGKIVRLSGHDPRNGPTEGIHGPFGLSLYLKGTDGRTYYMTHLGSRDVKEGQPVKPGSILGTVGDYARWGGADHVHMGVS